MSHHRRSPRSLDAALVHLQDQIAPASLLAEVQQNWSAAVGAAVAAEATPVAERGGVLTVSCSASVWAQELDLMAPLILDRLNQCVSSGQLSRLRCIAV